ncbi:thioesterase domain-containing protein [Mucilaginibacter sp. OK098]|uniref:thioesterase domain-containing protein n=1 Tax=Mucilaginibacter sp. OK098 TaxID=1855297 RepID=UPI0009156E1C|nr:thioesterase domain-containing protein [Mucilaginibacter sp. OK098]SHN33693.1 Phosphopantetheine attachment site [Mucilaginibacter sp. OK098]
MKKKNRRRFIYNVIFYDGGFLELTINGLNTRNKVAKKDDGLEQAMIAVQTDKNGRTQLAALFQKKRGYNRSSISAFLKEMIPDYMFPTSIMGVEQFPPVVKKNNDPDSWERFKVKSLDTNTSVLVVQQHLLEIWQSVLQKDNIGPNDNFFEHGGNNALAAFLTFRINTSFGLSMPLRWIYEVPTASALANRIDKAHTHAGVLDPQTNNMEVQKNIKIAHLMPSKTLQPFFFCPPLEGLQPTRSINGAINMALSLSDLSGVYSIHPPVLQPELLTRLKNSEDVNRNDVFWNKRLFNNLVKESVAHILNIQQTGPYWLGGYCTGSMMAMAISDLLIKKGKKVEKMVLLDAPLMEEDTSEDWDQFTRNDIIWFVSYDIGKDIPGMDWTSICTLVENVPDDGIWEALLNIIMEKKALPEIITVKDLKSAFEQKFYNYPAVHHCFDLIKYRYPANKVGSSLLLYSTSMFKTLPPGFAQYVKENILFGEVSINKVSVSHLGMFEPDNLVNWIDVIRKHLLKKSNNN